MRKKTLRSTLSNSKPSISHSGVTLGSKTLQPSTMGASDIVDPDASPMDTEAPEELKRTPGLVHTPGKSDDDLTPSEGRPTWFEEMINRMENTYVYVKDRDGYYMLVNDNFARQFNIVDCWRGTTDSTFLPEAICKQLAINDRGVMESREDQEILEEVPFPGEGCRTFMSWKFPLYAPDGTVRAMGGISIELEMVEFLRMKTNYMHGMLKSVVESGYRIEWPRGLTMPRLMHGESAVRRYGQVTESESKHGGSGRRRITSKFEDITDDKKSGVDQTALRREDTNGSDSASGSDYGKVVKRSSLNDGSDSSGRHHFKNEGEMDAQIRAALESAKPMRSMFGRGTVLRSDHMLYLKDETGRVLCKSKGWKTFEDQISKKDTVPLITESEASVLREGGYLEDDEVQIMADGTFKWLHAYYFLINGTHVFSVTGLDIKMPPKSRIVCCVKSDITSTKQRINQQKDIVRALMQWWKSEADPDNKSKGIKSSLASIESFLFDTTEDEDVNTLTAPNFPLFDQDIGHRREKGPTVHQSALIEDAALSGAISVGAGEKQTAVSAKRSYEMSGIADGESEAEVKRPSVTLANPRSTANSLQDIISYAMDPNKQMTNGNVSRDNSGNVTMSVDLPGQMTMSVTQIAGRGGDKRGFSSNTQMLNVGGNNQRIVPQQQAIDSAVSVSGSGGAAIEMLAASRSLSGLGQNSKNTTTNTNANTNTSIHTGRDSPAFANTKNAKGSMADVLQEREREQQQKLRVVGSADSLSHHISHLGVNSTLPPTPSGGRGDTGSISGFGNSNSEHGNSNNNTMNSRGVGSSGLSNNVFRTNYNGNNSNNNSNHNTYTNSRKGSNEVSADMHNGVNFNSQSMENMTAPTNAGNPNPSNSMNMNDHDLVNNRHMSSHNRPLSRGNSYQPSQHSSNYNQFPQTHSQRNNREGSTHSAFATPDALQRSVPLPSSAMTGRGSMHNGANDGWGHQGNSQSGRYNAGPNERPVSNSGSYNSLDGRGRGYNNDNDNYGANRNGRYARYDDDYAHHNSNSNNMYNNDMNNQQHNDNSNNNMNKSHTMNDNYGMSNDTISAHELAANVMARMSTDHSGGRRQSQVPARTSQGNTNAQPYNQSDMNRGGSYSDMNQPGSDNNNTHRSSIVNMNGGSRNSNHRNAHSPTNSGDVYDSWPDAANQQRLAPKDSNDQESEDRSDKQKGATGSKEKAAARRGSSLVKNELSRGKVKRPETLKQFVAFAENIAVPLTPEELNQALEKAVQFGTENVYTHRFNTGIRRIQGDTPDSLRGQFNLCQQNHAQENTSTEKSFDIISSGTAQTWFAKFLPHIQPPGLVSRGNKGKKKK